MNVDGNAAGREGGDERGRHREGWGSADDHAQPTGSLQRLQCGAARRARGGARGGRGRFGARRGDHGRRTGLLRGPGPARVPAAGGSIRERLEASYHPNIKAIRALGKPVLAAIQRAGGRSGALAGVRMRPPDRVRRRRPSSRASSASASSRTRVGRGSSTGSSAPAPSSGWRRTESSRPRRRWYGVSSPRSCRPTSSRTRRGRRAEWAGRPTRGVGLTKRFFEEAWTNGLDEQLELEAELQQHATGRLPGGRHRLPRETPTELHRQLGASRELRERPRKRPPSGLFASRIRDAVDPRLR